MAQVDAQIKQMVTFIQQEAQEKAREIQMQAEEEFTREKQSLVDQEKTKIRKEFDRKAKQIDVERKITRSNDIKNNRLRVLKARDDVVQQIRLEAFKAMPSTCDRNTYKNLIIQAVFKLRETDAKVRCRERDVATVRSVLEDAQRELREKSGNKDITVVLDDLRLSDEQCKSGGVVVVGYGDRIVVDNTMDRRMELCFEQSLPLIRKVLFGVPTAPETASSHHH